MRYEVIYADPPWSYRTWSGKGRGAAENHYGTMAPEAIRDLPVREIAARDCALFLWATFPNLPEALQVLQAWGFRYSTVAFVWVKRNRKSPGWFWGLGHWTRANSEVCLLGVRGNPRRMSASVHQVIEAPVGRHSAKPAEARDRIVRLTGDRPRIELFAREGAPGWDALGREIDGRCITESLPALAAAPTDAHGRPFNPHGNEPSREAA